jgi:hypothetical protein
MYAQYLMELDICHHGGCHVTSQVIVLLSSSLSIESDLLRPGLHNNLPSVSHQTRSTCATLTGSIEKLLLCVLVSSLEGISAGEFDSFGLCHQYWNLQKNNFCINSGFFIFVKMIHLLT